MFKSIGKIAALPLGLIVAIAAATEVAASGPARIYFPGSDSKNQNTTISSYRFSKEPPKIDFPGSGLKKQNTTNTSNTYSFDYNLNDRFPKYKFPAYTIKRDTNISLNERDSGNNFNFINNKSKSHEFSINTGQYHIDGIGRSGLTFNQNQEQYEQYNLQTKFYEELEQVIQNQIDEGFKNLNQNILDYKGSQEGNYQKEVSNLKAELGNFSGELNGLKTQIEEVKQAVSQKPKDYATNLSNLENKIAQVNTSLGNVNKANQSNTAKIGVLSTNIETLSTKLGAVESSVKALITNFGTSSKNTGDTKGIIDQVSTKVEEMNKAILDQVNAKIDALSKTFSENTKVNQEQVNTLLSTLKTEFQEQTKTMVDAALKEALKDNLNNKTLSEVNSEVAEIKKQIGGLSLSVQTILASLSNPQPASSPNPQIKQPTVTNPIETKLFVKSDPTDEEEWDIEGIDEVMDAFKPQKGS